MIVENLISKWFEARVTRHTAKLGPGFYKGQTILISPREDGMYRVFNQNHGIKVFDVDDCQSCLRTKRVGGHLVLARDQQRVEESYQQEINR